MKNIFKKPSIFILLIITAMFTQKLNTQYLASYSPQERTIKIWNIDGDDQPIKTFRRARVDGTKFHPTIHVSNIVITKFKRIGKKMDGWRSAMIEKKEGYLWEEELMAPKKGKKEEEE